MHEVTMCGSDSSLTQLTISTVAVAWEYPQNGAVQCSEQRQAHVLGANSASRTGLQEAGPQTRPAADET